MSSTTIKHKNKSSEKITCGIITLSDSRSKIEDDLSGNYISELIKEKYELKIRKLIPDEKKDLIDSIEESVKKCDVILINGGTGLSKRDITVETIEPLFDKKLPGFGELFRLKSYKEIGSSAILSRATGGVYKKTIIFSMPGSPNAVKTAMNLIIDELPHFVHHANR